MAGGLPVGPEEGEIGDWIEADDAGGDRRAALKVDDDLLGSRNDVGVGECQIGVDQDAGPFGLEAAGNCEHSDDRRLDVPCERVGERGGFCTGGPEQGEDHREDEQRAGHRSILPLAGRLVVVNIGILTAGGDSPGLNAAIRAIGKAAIQQEMQVIGFLDGFRGLMQNRSIRLDSAALSGILTVGGTILGTSRDKPHKMDVGGTEMDMTGIMIENCVAHQLDVLVCLGGGGTQKNALRLHQAGFPIVTLPKTIDNDVWGTDATFGFDTALTIATEAIDRLHSTAHSHHRIMLVEVMGHNAGWLALGAGLAGGADVILIPERPYRAEAIAEAISVRQGLGSTFSIIAVSEGARSQEIHDRMTTLRQEIALAEGDARKQAKAQLRDFDGSLSGNTQRLADELQSLTGLESRVTILGHVQRGGTPSAIDRLLATRLGTATVEFIAAGAQGVMVAARGDESVTVPLDKVAGRRRTVPEDHRWVRAAETLGVSFGQ